MWKTRVRTCLNKAIDELKAEARKAPDFDVTIRTELSQMLTRTRIEDHIQRLGEILAEIEATPERPPKKS